MYKKSPEHSSLTKKRLHFSFLQVRKRIATRRVNWTIKACPAENKYPIFTSYTKQLNVSKSDHAVTERFDNLCLSCVSLKLLIKTRNFKVGKKHTQRIDNNISLTL